MDPFVLATIVLTVWAAVGPVGVRYGNELSQRSARRQWLADERTKEWRGLLTVLTTSMVTIVQCNAVGGKTIPMMEADLRANTAAREALSNCLFIAQELRRRVLLDRWNEAVEAFQKDGDPQAFGEKFGRTVRFQIEEGARGDIGKV